jgi:hypothetical protein
MWLLATTNQWDEYQAGSCDLSIFVAVWDANTEPRITEFMGKVSNSLVT